MTTCTLAFFAAGLDVAVSSDFFVVVREAGEEDFIAFFLAGGGLTFLVPVWLLFF
jgi:hypothetical protein